jgi:hypothetical protein
MMVELDDFFPEHEAEHYGSTINHVSCAGCGTEYYYCATAVGKAKVNRFILSSSSVAEKKVQRQAQDRLIKTLESVVDAVPCPKCGEYQPGMLYQPPGIEIHGLFLSLGIFLAILAALCLMVAGAVALSQFVRFPPQIPDRFSDVEFIMITGGVGLTLVAVSVAFFVLDHWTDKNRRPAALTREERLELAARRTVLAEEYTDEAEERLQQMAETDLRKSLLLKLKSWEAFKAASCFLLVIGFWTAVLLSGSAADDVTLGVIFSVMFGGAAVYFLYNYLGLRSQDPERCILLETSEISCSAQQKDAANGKP